MSGTLYLIPNTLGDSAINKVLPAEVSSIAASLDYFVAENAKSARTFLNRVAQSVPLGKPIQQVEIRELNVDTPDTDLPTLLAPIKLGRDGGLLSEAGCPAIADPGAGLVELAHRKGIAVRPLVGPSSILLALMASGFNGQRFAFHGYLAIDPAQRRLNIIELERSSRQDHQTQIFIETPHRNMALFESMLQCCQPQTRLCVATDLTLAGESITVRTISQWKGNAPPFHKRPTIFLLLA